MRTIDLFSGCGGLSLGFQNAGFDIIAAFEYWDVAADCYEKNFSHPVFRVDLSDVAHAVDTVKNFKPEVIIGGPPCQDFSHAGKRVEADRASLTSSFAKIISQIRPKYFVMENVDRAEKSDAFQQARKIFKKAGYGLTQIVLDASHCGIPQKRKRFFCIGAIGESDDFLKKHLVSKMSKKETTLRDYFGDSLDFEYYYRHPRNYNRRAIFSIDEPAPTMRGMNRPVPKGYPGHPKDACPVSQNIRALTTLERALIQTFPPDFKWCGSKTDTEQMIGNAVPVKLAEFVATVLYDFIRKSDKISSDKDNFIKWLIEECKYSQRTANDTVSRVKRANTIYHIDNIPDNYYLLGLQESKAFNEISTSVRSQIKRSIVLYSKYLQYRNDT